VKKVVKLYLRATWAYLYTLFKSNDPVVSKTEGGFELLKGWTHSPEEKILEKLQADLDFKKNQRPLLWLFCIKGPHVGEIISLKDRSSTLGTSVHNSVIITPKTMANNTTYQVHIDAEIKISTRQGANFKINGREETQGILIDFDILEAFGNEFIVFENLAL
jgi:hypothetical protein